MTKLKHVLGAGALLAVGMSVAQAGVGEQLYTGAGAEAGKHVRLISESQEEWEQAWADRIGSPPPADLEEGQTGVLLVPARPSHYMQLSQERKDGVVSLHCGRLAGASDTGGWAAAVIEAPASSIRLVDCP